MSYVPLFLRITAQDRIVLVGGGPVALGKAQALSRVAGALTVVAEKVAPELHVLVSRAGGRVVTGPYAVEHLYGARLVIAATADHVLNARIHADAQTLGIPANIVDEQAACDFIFPAVVERGDIQIAISTAGVNPTLARLLKRRIEQLLPWNLAALADWLRGKRVMAREKLKSIQTRRLFWEEILDGPLPQEILEGNLARGEALFAQALEAQPAEARAVLYLIGAGPGHADLLTVLGARLLGQADVILHDRLITPDLLSRYARRDATVIAVGKQRDRHAKSQDEICALIERHLQQKRIVVRLKGGDPGIYAHSAEEIAVAARLGVPYQIVPGITAALGCAAASGIPLTERGGTSGVHFLTLYDERLHDAGFWRALVALKRDTFVFYMSTGNFAQVCERLLSAGFDAATPALLVEQGTTPQHTEFEAPLGEFAARHAATRFLTPALLIVGDVVRWRREHGWREAPRERKAYFAEQAHG